MNNIIFLQKNTTHNEFNENELSDKEDNCANIIISPPLQFIDTHQQHQQHHQSSQLNQIIKPKTRTDFIGDVLKISSDDQENNNDVSDDKDPVNKITQHLYTTLLSKLVGYRDKLNFLSSEYERLSRDLRDLDNKLISRAPYHVVDKYRVHVADTDKIVRLILSVTGRLVTINNDLDSLSWSGMEERMMMEQKRDKLLEQLEETKELWGNIDRRASTVISQVEHYMGYNEGTGLAGMLRMKVRLMVEKKELEEKIDIGEKQLGAMKVIETFEVIV